MLNKAVEMQTTRNYWESKLMLQLVHYIIYKNPNFLTFVDKDCSVFEILEVYTRQHIVLDDKTDCAIDLDLVFEKLKSSCLNV